MVDTLLPVSGKTVLGPHAYRLSPGQVVRMTMIEPGIGGGIVSFKGLLFRAEGHLPSARGDAFWAVIEKASPELIQVRHLPSGFPGAGAEGGLARFLGLPPDAATYQVLRAMLRWHLPVETATVRRLLHEMPSVPEGTRADWLDARVWLLRLTWSGQGQLDRALSYLLGSPDAGPEGLAALNKAGFPPGLDQVFVANLNGQPLLDGKVLWREQGASGAGVSCPSRVVIHIQSRGLGDLWFTLAFEGGAVAASVYSAEEGTAELARQYLSVLKEQLDFRGILVGSLVVKQRRGCSILDLMFPGEATGYRPVDRMA